MTKAAEKLAENVAFAARVAAVLKEAHAVADTASAAWAATARRTKEGRILDSCGGAMLVVYKPSHRLRTALAATEEIQSGHRGGWIISHQWTAIREQSATLEETGCQAACDVFRKAFPDDGNFYASTYID
jgi:hypothetical protein